MRFDTLNDISFGKDFDTFATTNRSASSGTLYFEVEAVSISEGGVLTAQVGFADDEFSAKDGAGGGDDNHSWGFGSTGKKWFGGGNPLYGKRWNEGDVIGCLASMDGSKNTGTQP